MLWTTSPHSIKVTLHKKEKVGICHEINHIISITLILFHALSLCHGGSYWLSAVKHYAFIVVKQSRLTTGHYKLSYYVWHVNTAI